MYCPNCGSQNPIDLKYCRRCGLRFDRIVELVVEENKKQLAGQPHWTQALFKRLAYVCLFSFVGVGFGYVFYLAVYYKFKYFGQDLMAMFGVFGFLLLGFLSLLFFGLYRNSFRPAVREDQPADEELGTNRLDGRREALGTSGTESARSVIEHTTERLGTPQERG